MTHGPVVPPGFMGLAERALSIVHASYPGAVPNTLRGSTSISGGVISPEHLEQMLATFRTKTGIATIQGVTKNGDTTFGPIQLKPGFPVGAPDPIIWSANGPAITAHQADAMIKCQGVHTPYTVLTLTSDDTPSLGPLNKGAGWNHYYFALLDGTACVSFKGKNQTSVQIHESQSSQCVTQTKNQSEEKFGFSKETQSEEKFQFSEETQSVEQFQTTLEG